MNEFIEIDVNKLTIYDNLEDYITIKITTLY
jgi:hypothetical protein